MGQARKHLTSQVDAGLFNGIDLGLEEPDVLLMVIDLETQPLQFLLHHLAFELHNLHHHLSVHAAPLRVEPPQDGELSGQSGRHGRGS
uniref:Uncharacterized protein n=1 Tax=Arundo donax TaxID=35708 RepID=A0A0A9FYS3_ARUDO